MVLLNTGSTVIEILFSVCNVHWSYFILVLLKLNGTTCPFPNFILPFVMKQQFITHLKFLPFTINRTISNTLGAKLFVGKNLKMKTWLSTSFIGFRVNVTCLGDGWFHLPKRRPLYWDTLGMRRPFPPRMNRVTFRSVISLSFVPHSTLRKSPVYFHEKSNEEPSFAVLLLLS